MGEAKRRAERRREAREEQAAQDRRPKYKILNEPLPERVIEQLKMRFAFLAGQFGSLGNFVAAVIEAGIEACDHDVNAVLAHQRGESKYVDPMQQAPKEERLIATPGEVSKEQMTALAQVSPLGSVRGKRTPQ